MDSELFLEKVQPTLKSKIEGMGLRVAESPNPENNTYFDFSGLDGLGYSQFKTRFLKICEAMAEYGTKIVYIPLEYWMGKYGSKVYGKPNNPIYNIIRMINIIR